MNSSSNSSSVRRLPTWISIDSGRSSGSSTSNETAGAAAPVSPRRQHGAAAVDDDEGVSSSYDRCRRGSSSPSRENSNRKYHQQEEQQQSQPQLCYYQESVLVTLIREGKWEDALRRCQTYPMEARPVPIQTTTDNAAFASPPPPPSLQHDVMMLSSSPTAASPSRRAPRRSHHRCGGSPIKTRAGVIGHRKSSAMTSQQQEKQQLSRHHDHRRPSSTNTDEPVSPLSTAPGTVAYHETALGALIASFSSSSPVSSSNEDDDEQQQLRMTQTTLCRALVAASPMQVRCGRYPQAAHTPLRDAVVDPSCPKQVLQILVEADLALTGTAASSAAALSSSEGPSSAAAGQEKSPVDKTSETPLPPAITQRDCNGLSPLDHLIKAVQLEHPHSSSSSSGGGAIDKVEMYLTTIQHHDASNEILTAALGNTDANMSPPLVRLFSLGTSFGIVTTTHDNNMIHPRLAQILACTRTLLRIEPAFIYQHSKCTGCSPLHVALRNYGNFAQLIRELIRHDVDGINMRHRNQYGDLPLHVASSVGVPFDLLRLILERTLLTTSTALTEATVKPHPLVWSTNSSGYTPIDVEWIRHIEGGNGFFSHRPFYPLDSSGIRKYGGGRYDELYTSLLRQAVDQVIATTKKGARTKRPSAVGRKVADTEGASAEQKDAKSKSASTALMQNRNGHHEDDSSFGLLMHRIFLIIRVAFHDSSSVPNPSDPTSEILHQACALLSGASGPTLPRPILELILWQYPAQVERKDYLGRLPLHYSVQIRKTKHPANNERPATKRSIDEWQKWVKDLLRKAPHACSVADNQGRLPLHCALVENEENHDESGILEQSDGDQQSLHQQPYNMEIISRQARLARGDIVLDIVQEYPDATEKRDPITKLYPFQQAAASPHVSLQTVFALLRRSPGCCSMHPKDDEKTSNSSDPALNKP